MCCVCHQVSDEDSGWSTLDDYLDRHHVSGPDFQLSHTYCPSCYDQQIQAWHIAAPLVVPPRAA
jgi:hypothetical protein